VAFKICQNACSAWALPRSPYTVDIKRRELTVVYCASPLKTLSFQHVFSKSNEINTCPAIGLILGSHNWALRRRRRRSRRAQAKASINPGKIL